MVEADLDFVSGLGHMSRAGTRSKAEGGPLK